MIAYVRRRPEGVPLDELAAYLGCSREDVALDIDAALLCGAPPYLPSDYVNAGVEGDRVFISFADHIARPIALTIQESLGLLLALRSLPVGMAEYETVTALRQKILGLLPGKSRRDVRRIGRRIRLGGRRGRHGRTINMLERAIAQRREAHIEYYTASRDAMSERDFRPYGLIEHDGHWYAVGWCLMRQRELPFRVDRIRSISLTKREFTLPQDFDIEKYSLPEMFFPTKRGVRVTIRLAPELVRWVREERLNAEMRPTADGGALLGIRVSHPEWLVAWTLQHGSLAEIVAPEDLRNRMREYCDATLAVYGEDR